MLKIFWVFVLLQASSLVRACSRRRRPAPQPCSWRTCYHEWRNSFSPGIRQGECVRQSRYSSHVYRTNHGTAPCPASTSCNWRSQSRLRCSCRQVHDCRVQGWSNWSGNIPTNQCKRQSRCRSWVAGRVTYPQQDNNCNGIRSSCGNREYDYRTLCSCQYAKCETLPWTPWTQIATRQGHCLTEARYQRQKKTIVYKTQVNNCNNVGPQDCHADVSQVREKVVYCPALANPAVGRWDRAQCSQSRQACKSHCTIECTHLTGYKRTGGEPTRTCLSSGTWSQSTAYCQDTQSPVITCPSPATFGNDVGKKYKTVTLPDLVSATDNSGKRPTITTSIGKPQHNFAISAHAYEVTYTARDEAGLTRTCPWYVTIKDTEKPKVMTCPQNIKKITKQEKERISWNLPTFQDNYDPYPVINSDKQPGSFFFYGETRVTYTATDSAGNVAHCQFDIILSVLHCPTFRPPRHGAQACNLKVNDQYEQHLYCTTVCQQGYSWISDDVYDYYQCGAGLWTGFNKFPAKIYRFADKSVRPWADCTLQENAAGVKKVINAYVGECDENNPDSLLKIKQDFIAALDKFMIAKLVFCNRHQANCQVSNVKVYCGRSKRSGDSSKQVVSVEIVMLNKETTTDKAKALKQHELMKLDLDATEMAADQKIISQMDIAGMHIEAYESKIACKKGEIVKVSGGDGDEMSRSSCVKCAEGTFFSDEEECIPCAEGTYQDNEGETQCIQCPEGTWTVGNQASNSTECIDVCGPGEYSQHGNGLANCIACPMGTYQANFRQSSCIECPSGKTTKLRGAASEEDCE